MHFSNQKRRPVKRCRRGRSQSGCPNLNLSPGVLNPKKIIGLAGNFKNSILKLLLNLSIYFLKIFLCIIMFLLFLIISLENIFISVENNIATNISFFIQSIFFDFSNFDFSDFDFDQEIDFNFLENNSYAIKALSKLNVEEKFKNKIEKVGGRKFTSKSVEELSSLFNGKARKNIGLREVKRLISKMEKNKTNVSKTRKEKKLLSVKLKQRTDSCTLLKETLEKVQKENAELLELESGKTGVYRKKEFERSLEKSDGDEVRFIREKLEVSKETSEPGELVDVLLNADSSFRSFSKIIKGLSRHKLYVGKYSPSPNTLINWMIRGGISKLRNVELTSEPCIDIIDHWIGSGDCKIFAVIRITHSKYQKRMIGAVRHGNYHVNLEGLKLSDFDLVHLEIVRKSNGEKVSSSLDDLYKRIGFPLAIISDSGSDLCKGIKLLNDQNSKSKCQKTVKHISDISHKFALSFKKEYEKEEWFIDFFKELSSGNAKLKNTGFSHLKSSPQNTKARFMNIGKQVGWYIQGVKNLEEKNLTSEEEAKFMDTYISIFSHNEKIEHLYETINLSNKIMKILKTKGLNKKTHKQCLKIIFKTTQGNPRIKKDIINWLNDSLEINKELIKRGWTSSMPVTSDSIESFFSKFKSFQKRVPQGDPTRLVAILPLVVGEISAKEINKLIRGTSHKESQEWINENVPETIHSKKRKIMAKSNPVRCSKKRTKMGKGENSTKRPYIQAVAS